MTLTGFTDEAAPDLATQIEVTQQLGWSHLSARSIDGTNIHDLCDPAFERVVEQLDEAGIHVAEFGSLIGSWSKSIHSDFDLTLAEIDRAIPRMHRLGTRIIRVMSYAQEPWGKDQHEQERFRRLRTIVDRFTAADLIPAHENCMNWGGLSAEHSLRLVDEVPGLKLIFDTGNPVFQMDRSQPHPDGTFPWQNSLDFFRAVKTHVIHIHIKDCTNPPSEGVEPVYLFPGKGQAMIQEILDLLRADNYQGFIAIEPHVATVFHLKEGQSPDWKQCYESYFQYGRKFEKLLVE